MTCSNVPPQCGKGSSRGKDHSFNVVQASASLVHGGDHIGSEVLLGTALCGKRCGVTHQHPALDFDLYGLVGWPGARWLEFVDGQAGEPVWAAWLAHVERDQAARWSLVATLPAARYAMAMAVGAGQDLSREVAFMAVHRLLNATSPNLALDKPARERYLHDVVDLAEQQAEHWADWPSLTWSVDHCPVQARLWRWAGAWAAFTTELAGVAVIVLGHHLEPAGLELTTVDPHDYHFIPEAPIAYPGTLESARSIAGTTLPAPGTGPCIPITCA